MNTNSIYVSINPITIAGGDTLNELNIFISYDKGGYNYFHGGVNRRGIYVHFSPVTRIDLGGYSTVRKVITGNMRESGFKVFLKELGRKSQKQEDYFFNMIEPYKEKIAELWNENNFNEIYSTVQMVINK